MLLQKVIGFKGFKRFFPLTQCNVLASTVHLLNHTEQPKYAWNVKDCETYSIL